MTGENQLPELKKHLRQLEEDLLKPEVRTSRDQLKKLLADDFFEIGSSGRILFKNEDIPEAGIGIVKMKMSDFKSTLYPVILCWLHTAFLMK